MFSSRFIWNTEPNPLSIVLDQKKAQNETIFDLTVSNPTTAGFEYSEKAIFQALTHAESLTYSPNPKGLVTARNAVCHYYRRHSRMVDPESLILTTGTSESYGFVFRLLCDPGAEVLVPVPGYPLLDFLAGFEFLKIVPYHSRYDDMTGWHIDLDDLHQAVSDSTEAIVIVNPNNPTGAFISKPEFDAVTNICIENDIAIISDEVFLDYMHLKSDQYAGSLIGTHEVLTFVLSGLSKIAGLPQVKLGWIQVSGPSELSQAAVERLEWIADTYLSVSSMVQYGANQLINQSESIRQQIIGRVNANEIFLNQRIHSQHSVRQLIRQGGWYAVLEFEDQISDDDRTMNLIQNQNVLVHPGYFFGFDRDGFLIVSLLTQPEIFQEGIEKILRQMT